MEQKQGSRVKGLVHLLVTGRPYPKRAQVLIPLGSVGRWVTVLNMPSYEQWTTEVERKKCGNLRGVA